MISNLVILSVNFKTKCRSNQEENIHCWKAKEMYEDLSPETGKFFNFMIENELMDLVANQVVKVGDICISFWLNINLRLSSFSNFNGTKGDIDVITHEAGHAFQNFMSQDMKLLKKHFNDLRSLWNPLHEHGIFDMFRIWNCSSAKM